MKIVFDIGGTNMRIASADGVMLGTTRKVPTPQDFDAMLAQFVDTARDIAGGDVIEGVAGCIAAQIDDVQGIYDASNRPAWNGRHFDTELAALLGAPVLVGNDCSVIGLGEYQFGAGKGVKSLAYVTVSTGVGAGHVVDGNIMPLDGFFFGHTPIEGGELEQMVSGTAVRKKFNIEPKELESIDERNKLADLLAQGLVAIIEKWHPERIVLGGSMIIGVNPIPLDRVQESLTKLVSTAPEIKMAELGDNGGLYGGMVLAKLPSS
jgi:predicted NBD/HSP70 family sugar kinase